MSSHQRDNPRFVPASLQNNKKILVARFVSLPTSEQAKEFLPVSKLAELLSLSPRTIRQWIVEDKVAAITVGMRKQFVFLPSVERFLQQIQDWEIAVSEDDDGE